LRFLPGSEKMSSRIKVHEKEESRRRQNETKRALEGTKV